MKTDVQDTSITAYYEIDDLGKRQFEVLGVLARGDCSNTEISKILGLPINSVTGRTRELRDAGLVELKRIKICPYTGRSVKVWGVARNDAPGSNLCLFPNEESIFEQGSG